MKTKKGLILFSAIILALVASLPIVFAAASPFSSLKDLLYDVFRIFLDVFKLGFLKGTSDLVAFTRLMIWVITFALFHASLQLLMTVGTLTNLGNTRSGQRLPAIISFCLATITAIFMPENVILAIGITYSAVWAAIILVAVFAAMIYLCYGVIRTTPGQRNTWIHVIRLAILFFCWMLIYNITTVVEAGVPGLV